MRSPAAALLCAATLLAGCRDDTTLAREKPPVWIDFARVLESQADPVSEAQSRSLPSWSATVQGFESVRLSSPTCRLRVHRARLLPDSAVELEVARADRAEWSAYLRAMQGRTQALVVAERVAQLDEVPASPPQAYRIECARFPEEARAALLSALLGRD